MVLAALLVGCSERALPPPEPSADTLRVAVRAGFETAMRQGVDAAVEQHALVLALGSRIDREIALVEPADGRNPLEMVAAGMADIAVGDFSLGDAERAGLAATAAPAWVEELVVSTQDGPIVSFDDLEGARLSVPELTARRLAAESGVPGGARVETVAPDEPLETVLKRVATGRYAATVADSALIASIQRQGWQLRIVGPVAERRPAVWAVRRDDDELLVSVNDFLFAERVLADQTPVPACRDLEEIRHARLIRLITHNASSTVTVSRGGLEGFEYDLALSFARELGLRLELVLPPPGESAADWLRRGYGDLVALHEPPPLGVGDLLVTRPYRHVDLVAVVGSRSRLPATFEGLGGLSVAASSGTLTWLRELPAASPPVALRAPRGGGDALSAVTDVVRGRVYAAVLDSDTAALELAARPGLRGTTLVVPSVPLVWMVSPSAPRLLKRLDRFLARSRRNGLIRQLELNYFEGHGRWVPLHVPEVPGGALTPFDDLLRAAGRRHGLDWRLLASLMYEESRFDTEAVGPGGSAGLFQFMPFTWRELGVNDPHDPVQAADAGARYLKQLMDGLADVPLRDRVAMAVASYNVGPRHVFDARALAEDMGLDRDRWHNSVETAMVLLDDPEVARQYPAGVCRCRRAVGYTRRILRRYAAYRAAHPPTARRPLGGSGIGGGLDEDQAN